MTLSVVMVTYNSADVVEGAVQSVQGVADEVLVGDGGSRDGTVEIVARYGAKVIPQRPETALGVRKQELVEKAKGAWILALDADERVSEELAKEINDSIRRHNWMAMNVVAYRIPYQNYVFGKPVYYGGERYSKVRLFRKGHGKISPLPLHEEIEVVGDIGELKGKIHHHSYRTLWQLLGKFTRYAWVASQNARASWRALFLHAPHLFWARFVREKGYKDGWRGLILAAAFASMEGLTYWFALIRQPKKP